MFEQQAAPSNTGCALQSKFMANVLWQFTKATRSQSRLNPSDEAPPPPEGQQLLEKPSRTRAARGTGGENNPGSANFNDRYKHGTTVPQISVQSQQQPALTFTSKPVASQPVPLHNYYNTGPARAEDSEMQQEERSRSGLPMTAESRTTELPFFVQRDYVFTDEGMWAAMFANAGFSIDHGVFLPDLMDVNDGSGNSRMNMVNGYYE